MGDGRNTALSGRHASFVLGYTLKQSALVGFDIYLDLFISAPNSSLLFWIFINTRGHHSLPIARVLAQIRRFAKRSLFGQIYHSAGTAPAHPSNNHACDACKRPASQRNFLDLIYSPFQLETAPANTRDCATKSKSLPTLSPRCLSRVQSQHWNSKEGLVSVSGLVTSRLQRSKICNQIKRSARGSERAGPEQNRLDSQNSNPPTQYHRITPNR